MNLIEFLAENANFVLNEKSTLNPSIWKKDHVIPEVKAAMLKIADAFLEFVNADEMEVIDITLTGSLANYTWHEKSDVDIHIIAKLPSSKYKEDMLELFSAKKALWNAEHDISIKGFAVELYVQPSTEKHSSSGVYSLKNAEWIVQPKKVNPSINDDSVIRKANVWKSRIDDLIKNKRDNMKSIDSFKTKLRTVRQMGLDRDGEFAIENLAFKILRNDGYIKKLYDYSKELIDKKLSLK